jgi:Spy/CpxP family protein refolding chaperone
MINKVLALVLIFSLAFNIAFVGIWGYQRTISRSARPVGLGRQVRRGPGARPLAELDLPPEVQQGVSERVRHLQEQIRKQQASMQVQRNQLFRLLDAPEMDEQAVQEAYERLEAAQKDTNRLVLEHMRKLREVLTPEQYRKLMGMMRNSAEGQRMGRRPGGGQQWRPRGMRERPMPEAPRQPETQPRSTGR